MKLSYNRLKSLVCLDDTDPGRCAAALTLSGSKVETVENSGADIQNVVVGRVLALRKHPNADRLTVCDVDAGNGRRLQICTGATNLFAGATVPVALDGALLPGGKEIHSGQMRGEKSEGMLCSGSELNLDAHDHPGADAGGILILPDDIAPLGTDAADALCLRDTVIDFEITNNRPDCFSVRGLARETAATLGKTLCLPEARTVVGEGDMQSLLKITVEAPALCPRYAARMVTDVKIEPSPQWMRRALRSMGVRPINNIVDITNYVMLEFGQPMHAFDHAAVGGGELRIRTAREGEVLETLDGQSRRLDPGMLVIADAERATAVAGVMGGAASEITDSTRTIVFESACFNGVSVRKTALALGMRTDASSRFEKGLDQENVLPALEYACELVEQLGAGKVIGGRIDVCAHPAAMRTLPLPVGKINAHLGVSLSEAEMLALLAPLGFGHEGGDVTIPSWRADVERWQDLSEEIARMYGYDRIPATLTISKNRGLQTPWQLFRERVSTLCLALGYDESLTVPFIGNADLDRLRLAADDPRRNAPLIVNPIGEEAALLRPFLLPSLLDSLARNAASRNPSARLFESATVFIKSNEALPHEELRLVIGVYGGGADFFTLKGDLEALLAALDIPPLRFRASEDDGAFHPGRTALLSLGEKQVGILGELHPALCEEMGFQARVCAAELALAPLFEARLSDRSFEALPRYPSTTRDLALVCPAELPHAEILDAVRAAGGTLLYDCELFDIYTGEHIPAGKRGLGYRLTFRAVDRTLRDEEADEAAARVLKALEEKPGVALRT